MTAGSISYTRGEDPLRADKLNASFSERLLVVGDTMLGPLILFRDPQVPFEAVTKQYTDALVTSKLTGFLSTTGGTMYGPLFLFRDPQTATEASTKQYTDAKAASVAAAYLPLTGGTLLGNLTLAGDAVSPFHPVTLHQLTSQGSTASIAVGDTPPVPGLNKLWWDSVACQLYIWFDDGTSSQWVPAMAVPASIGEAPNNGSVYARQSGQWTDIGTTSLSKNLLHNSQFNIAQRGAGPWNGVAGFGYTLDRWIMSNATSLDTLSMTQAPLSDTDRAGIGDEAALFALQNVFTGSATAAAQHNIEQRIEYTRRLSGKTLTLSFWAKCSAGALKLGVNFFQIFGTGGSPSAFVQVLPTGNAVTLATTWARYSMTIAMPSVIGKTLGTNNDDGTWVRIYYSSAATTNVAAGNIGVQSGTISLWGVQLEIGNTATALEKIDPQQDLAKCQRFYQIGTFYMQQYQPAGGISVQFVPLIQTMRTTPTLAVNSPVTANVSSYNLVPQTSSIIRMDAGAAATGGFTWGGNYTASADL